MEDVDSGDRRRADGRFVPNFHTQVVPTRADLGIPTNRLSTREEEVIRRAPYPFPQRNRCLGIAPPEFVDNSHTVWYHCPTARPLPRQRELEQARIFLCTSCGQDCVQLVDTPGQAGDFHRAEEAIAL